MYPVLISLGPVTIYTFGVFSLIALVMASFVVWKRGVENHFSEEDIFDTFILVALFGLIGARLAYIGFHFDQFQLSFLRWISVLRVPGLSIFGGLLLGSIGLWFISRRKRWSYYAIADISVTGLALAQSVGWIGAFFRDLELVVNFSLSVSFLLVMMLRVFQSSLFG